MATIQNNQLNNGIILNESNLALYEQIKNNPGRVIELAYENLALATAGKIDVPNPSHPFGYLLEASAVQASMLHLSNEAIYRKQYPVLATTYNDLYNHMFDGHYLGRFSMPGRAMIQIHFPLESLLEHLADTDIEGVKQLIIPRSSTIVIGQYVFTLLYPIIIKQLPHKGIQILYDTSEVDPVQSLASNIIDWSYVTINGIEYIRIRPMMLNVALQVVTDNLIQGNGFEQTFNFDNRYCHCRVYHLTQDGWREMHTTHSDIVYDTNAVTARLTYLENKLRVTIPPIYFNKNMTGEKIRIEIYTTLGNVEEMMERFSPEQFEHHWSSLDNLVADTRYVAGLELVEDVIVFSEGLLKGGKEPESFEETRDRVVNFANYTEQPITSNQLKTTLKVKDYHIVKSRDTITSRGYLAVRSLPLNKYDTFNAGAASAMERVKVKLDVIAKHPAVRDNGKRLTITPEMLYRNRDGIVSVVFPEDTPNRTKLGTDKYLGEINSLEYSFSPFYYVVDTNDNTLDMRAYYFNKPKIENTVFINNNSSSGFNVSTDDITIFPFKTETQEGFKVRIVTRSTPEYKDLPLEDLFCQMAIRPIKEKSFAYINGKLLGKMPTTESGQENHVWEFTLPTKWDVTANDGLILHDMYLIINEPRKFEVDLSTELHFVYGVKNMQIIDHEPDAVDKMINKEIIDSDIIVGITHDKVDCVFGDRLKNFWCNAITIQDSRKYERYEQDVPRVYSKDIYRRDSDGLYVLDNNGRLIVEHAAGSPVLDENNKPILLARKGDVKIDAEGNPIKEQDRTTQRILDIMMVDGIYYFATDENDMKYRDIVSSTVRDWIVNDLKDISNVLLENTELYFYPKRTLGDATLIVDGGLEIQTAMRLSFKVTYYLMEESYGNLEIREAISKTTHDEINNILMNKTVSTSDIITLLKEKAGSSVKAVDVKIIGPRNQITIFTSEDDSVRCSVKRVVKAQADKTLKVVEDIEVNFVKHDTIAELRS